MPLPATLAPGPFSTSAARGLGVPAARLLRSDLVHPTRGSHALLGPTDLRERALAYAVGMPQERAFSHLTAAALHGLPLPRRLEASAREGELHVIAPTSDGRVAREGCVGHRGLERRHTEVIDGIRVTSLAETWCDFGELPRGLLTITDLVVLGDAVAARMDAQLPAECQPRAGDRRSRGIEDMQAALLRRVRPRGKRALVHALTLMRPRVRSAMETRARLIFVLAGFPEPEVNAPVVDRAGEWLGEGDLVWRAERVVGEYQGSHHADITRRAKDTARLELFRDHGWQAREIFASDAFDHLKRELLLVRFAQMLGLDPSRMLID